MFARDLYHGQIEYIRNWGIQGFRNLKYEFINSSIPKFAIPEFGSPINRNFHFVPTGFAWTGFRNVISPPGFPFDGNLDSIPAIR